MTLDHNPRNVIVEKNGKGTTTRKRRQILEGTKFNMIIKNGELGNISRGFYQLGFRQPRNA